VLSEPYLSSDDLLRPLIVVGCKEGGKKPVRKILSIIRLLVVKKETKGVKK
jgi:hypothetical protein